MEHPLSKVFRLLSLDFQSNRKQHKEPSSVFDIIIIVVVVVVVAVIIIIITLIIRFVIKDESGSPILKIEGPLCPCSCCGDVDFNVREFKSSLSGKNIQIYICLYRNHALAEYVEYLGNVIFV